MIFLIRPWIIEQNLQDIFMAVRVRVSKKFAQKREYVRKIYLNSIVIRVYGISFRVIRSEKEGFSPKGYTFRSL